jgi:DNA-binding transcriptional ArsR family regulator
VAKRRDPLQPERCAEVLAALAAPERLRIIRLLAEGERNVSQIIKEAEIPALNVAHHLSVLKHARLVQSRKQGRYVIYSITPEILDEVVNAGISRQALNLGCCQLVLPCETSDRTANSPQNRECAKRNSLR